MTTFVRDLQSRITSKQLQNSTSISYVYENTTSRLKSMTDAKQQRTNCTYFADNNTDTISYTNTSGGALIPATPSVSYIYDPNYNRISSMTDGTGLTSYGYYAVSTPPVLGAIQLQTVDGPLTNDTITYGYDELGRRISRSISGVTSSIAYDSLGRLDTSDNTLGHFSRVYDGATHVTPRLKTVNNPNNRTTNFTYFGNSEDRRLQTLQDLDAAGLNVAQSDYLYD